MPPGGHRAARKMQLANSGVDSLADTCVDFIIGHLESIGEVVDDYGRVSLREGVTLPLEICQVNHSCFLCDLVCVLERESGYGVALYLKSRFANRVYGSGSG